MSNEILYQHFSCLHCDTIYDVLPWGTEECPKCEGQIGFTIIYDHGPQEIDCEVKTGYVDSPLYYVPINE